jgi:riboflavin kinase/FMN adenylyltransferase
MKVARKLVELGDGPRAVALGTFDGVHLGHRRVIETLLDAGPEPTVVTFDPHPRTALGNRVDLLMSLERRLELLAGLGVEAALVVEFTLDVARLEPQAFADEFLRPIGVETVVAGEDFRFGRARQGDLTLLESLGFATRPVALLENVSSRLIRELVRDGDVHGAAQLLGRPVEVEGVVVTGDARGGTLGFPTANLDLQHEARPPRGVYAALVSTEEVPARRRLHEEAHPALRAAHGLAEETRGRVAGLVAARTGDAESSGGVGHQSALLRASRNSLAEE